MTSLPPERPLPNPSLASAFRRIVSPAGMNAPKDWPPPPQARTVMESSGREDPNCFVISLPRIVPNARSVLETSVVISAFYVLSPSAYSFRKGSRISSSFVFSRWKS